MAVSRLVGRQSDGRTRLLRRADLLSRKSNPTRRIARELFPTDADAYGSSPCPKKARLDYGVLRETANMRLRVDELVLATAVAVCSLLASSAHGLSLPDYIKACGRFTPRLNECVKEHAGPVIGRLKNGIPEFNVPPMDPLYLKEVKAESGRLGIAMQSVDVRIHGLSKSKPIGQWANKVSPPSFRWNLLAPRLEITSKYEVDGRILLLPIVGKGDLNITLTDVDYVFSFDCDLERREDNKEYLVPRSSHIDFKSSRMYTTLTNLFNGNRLLGNQMNYFLNENWREVQKEFGPPIANALAKAIRKIVNGITKKVPYDVIFPAEE